MATVERLTNCTTGGPVFVDVRDGRIVRLTPIELSDDDKGDWTIEARGRSFTSPRKTTLSPHAMAHKSMIYSPQRLLTPLKRTDFDPKGKRNIHNRGVSGYEPISWEQALDMVTDEVERVKTEVGPAAILSTPGSHHMWGNIGYRHSTYFRFMNLLGFTYGEHNPDSWEGWHWGAMHMWGTVSGSASRSSTTCSKTPSSTPTWWSSGPPTPRPPAAASTPPSRAPPGASG